MWVWIKTQFVGFHRWKDAPAEYDYLRSYHRHEFHVKASASVDHGDRQIEFHDMKKTVEALIRAKWDKQYFEGSCEDVAIKILEALPDLYSVEVSEDGECGAFVTRRDL